MKNTFGDSLAVTIFGESHGAAIGAVLDGLASGIPVDEELIARRLSQRRPSGEISTARREADRFRIISGVYGGKTTGTPLCIEIENSDTRSADYAKMETLARPGHADYTAQMRYRGYQDIRGGGHFSGRITAAVVAAGAIVERALADRGIAAATHILTLGGVGDRSFSSDPTAEIEALREAAFPTISADAGELMRGEILAARERPDSIGGRTETAVVGLPAGVGEPFCGTAEGLISHAIFAIPAIKGIEFGAGFDFCRMSGSEANDAFYSENGRIYTKTNMNGGINGGITNGMPIVFSCAVKPTPSIAREQDTVNYITGEEAKLTVHGRHDPCIVHRACPVISAMTELVLYDMLSCRYGTEYFAY